MTIRDFKIEFEERFHQKWTSLSIQFHFKSVISHVLKIKFSEVNLRLSEFFPQEKVDEYVAIVDRLEKDEPLQYILGETEFWNCRILCSPVALIPRPKTEELVELAIKSLRNVPSPRILDLCTGTGCIAIALASVFPQAYVFGIDHFEEVIDLAIANQKRNHVQVNFSQIDVLSESQMKDFESESYDLWISNPPYIPRREKERMEKNVLEYEPEAALFVPDNDPLLFYREIAKSAQKGLKSNGHIFYEIHEDFGLETIALLEELDFKNITLHTDLQGKNRMISAQK